MSEDKVYKTGELCAEALEILTGDRQKDYGDAYENFKTVTELINIKLEYEMMPSDIVQVMICLKESRQMSRYKVDNIRDLIGYHDLLQMCLDREKGDPDFHGKA